MEQDAKPKDDRYLMPWVIATIDDEPTKTCVLIAKMNGHEIESISLHVDRPKLP